MLTIWLKNIFWRVYRLYKYKWLLLFVFTDLLSASVIPFHWQYVACFHDEKVSQHHLAWSSCNTYLSPITAVEQITECSRCMQTYKTLSFQPCVLCNKGMSHTLFCFATDFFLWVRLKIVIRNIWANALLKNIVTDISKILSVMHYESNSLPSVVL